MKKFFRISTSSSGYSDSELEDLCKVIIANCSAHADLQFSIPKFENFKVNATAFANARAAALQGGKQLVTDKNNAREKLAFIFTSFGVLLMELFDGDEEKLTKTGYPIYKPRVPVTVHAPLNLAIMAGLLSGQLRTICDAVKGKQGYNWQFCTDAPTAATVWVSFTSGNAGFTFKSLHAGTQYWIRVGAVDKNNEVHYCEPIAKYCA